MQDNLRHKTTGRQDGVHDALRVGITGHRILADFDKLHAGLEKALDTIQQAFPDRRIVVLSSLAEGADRLAAQHALLRPGAGLVVPLPLSVKEYLRDFDSECSKVEFLGLLKRADSVVELPPAKTRNGAYAAAGHYVADNCDVLLALWDGRESQGHGGTAEVVARVRTHNRPVVIVRAGNRKPGTHEPTTLGPEQGRVIAERMGPAR